MTRQETDPVVMTQVLKKVECVEESMHQSLNPAEKLRIEKSISPLNEARAA